MKRFAATLFVLTLFAASMSAQSTPVNMYAYEGKFKDSKITVTIWLEENADGIVSGEIVYTSSKHKTPMRLLGNSFTPKDGVYYFGSSFVSDGTKSFLLKEYQKDGLLTGEMQINKDLKSGKVSGSWFNNNTKNRNKPVVYDMILTPVSFPKGKGGTLAYSSNPVGKYGFHYYDYCWEGELGGWVEISNLKGNTRKKRVYIDNASHNIAEHEENLVFGKGLFHGNVKPCHIKYDVHVFKDFVYVTYTDSGDVFCPNFGEGASLEGFYPKVR